MPCSPGHGDGAAVTSGYQSHHFQLCSAERLYHILLMPNDTLLQVDLAGFRKLKSGKVREIFDLGDRLLFVASDRISAFDCIMPNGIPRKGEVLTQISHFWFDQTSHIIPNHRWNGAVGLLPPGLETYLAKIERRSMLVKKAQPLAIECVARGYLAGLGSNEYSETQTVCGIKLR